MAHRRTSNPEYLAKEVENTKLWKERNRDKHLAQLKRYGERHKEKLTTYYNKWLKANWKQQMAYRYARKKRIKQATPKWANIDDIQEFYLNCPKGYHVDHTIPLHGKNVCGLHIIDNLQYLPAKANLSKGNKVA